MIASVRPASGNSARSFSGDVLSSLWWDHASGNSARSFREDVLSSRRWDHAKRGTSVPMICGSLICITRTVDCGSLRFIVVLCTVDNAGVSAALNTSFRTWHLGQNDQLWHLSACIVLYRASIKGGLNIDWLWWSGQVIGCALDWYRILGPCTSHVINLYFYHDAHKGAVC